VVVKSASLSFHCRYSFEVFFFVVVEDNLCFIMQVGGSELIINYCYVMSGGPFGIQFVFLKFSITLHCG